MYKVKVNDHFEFEADLKHSGDELRHSLNGTEKQASLVEVKPGVFHLIDQHKSYLAEIIDADLTTKSFLIRVNNNNYSVKVEDEFDQVLKQMGMDFLNSGKVPEIKAPMPGLVLDIKVQPGDSVKKGDPVVVLEAMKMENILKSPVDATIAKVNVNKGEKVEKNSVLIQLK